MLQLGALRHQHRDGGVTQIFAAAKVDVLKTRMRHLFYAEVIYAAVPVELESFEPQALLGNLHHSLVRYFSAPVEIYHRELFDAGPTLKMLVRYCGKLKIQS